MWGSGVRVVRGSLSHQCAAGSSPTASVGGSRLFSSTPGLLGHQPFRIPSLVLEELKKTTPIADVDASKRYVVLLPSQTSRKGKKNIRGTRRSGLGTMLKSTKPSANEISRETSRSNTRQGILRASIADFYQAKMEELGEGESLSIDSIRPPKGHSPKVTIQRFDLLRQLLTRGFTRAQLVEYVQNKYSDSSYVGIKKGLASKTKNALAEIILEDIWGIQKTDELASWDELALSKLVEMTDEAMFLLLQGNGTIIRYLSRSGAKILFDPETMMLKFAGTELQVAKADQVWNVLQNNIAREVVNLENIKKLFMEKYKEFPLLKFQKQAEVFFKPLNSNEYELVTLEKSQLKRAKRLLLWLLNYNSHLKETIFLPDSTQNLQFLPYKNNKAIPWTLRQDQLFELRSSTNDSQENSLLVLKQLESFSDENMSNPRLSYETEIEFAKSLPTDRLPTSKEMAEMERTSLELLAELGFGLETDSTKVPEKIIDAENTEAVNSLLEEISTSQLQLPVNKREELYNELTDFSHTKNLKGLENSNKVMTVTLGNILFKGNEEATTITDEIVPASPEIQSLGSLPYVFNSDVSFATDRVLSLNPFGTTTLSTNEINRMLSEDPSHYSLQLKYAPTPFINDPEQLREQVKYPQVEIWFELDERKCVDLDSMAIVTVEGLNNCYVSLPEGKVDLKITCQSTASMLEENGVEETDEFKEKNDPELSELEISALLNEVTDKYSRFSQQPGLREFLEKSKLGFNGRSKVQIESHIDFIIDGKPIRYQYLSVAHVRKLDFGFGDRFVQLSMIEGGQLGGRQVEITLVGDLEDGISKESFDLLVDDSLRLVGDL